jgi:hypothetical protein
LTNYLVFKPHAAKRHHALVLDLAPVQIFRKNISAMASARLTGVEVFSYFIKSVLRRKTDFPLAFSADGPLRGLSNSWWRLPSLGLKELPDVAKGLAGQAVTNFHSFLPPPGRQRRL